MYACMHVCMRASRSLLELVKVGARPVCFAGRDEKVAVVGNRVALVVRNNLVQRRKHAVVAHNLFVSECVKCVCDVCEKTHLIEVWVSFTCESMCVNMSVKLSCIECVFTL